MEKDGNGFLHFSQITKLYTALNITTNQNGLYAQLHYFLNFSQLLVSFLPLLDKLN